MPGLLEDRYQLCPQMRVYDRLEPVLMPYVTFSTPPNFRSQVVNTDRHGFRVSYCGQVRIDCVSWWQAPHRGLVLGGSFVFGVGSTQDRSTLVSELAGRTGTAFLNLGVRAGNSLQQLIAALPFLASANTVVVCSGMNTLVTHAQSLGMNDLYGPLFGEECLEVLSRQPLRDIAGLLDREVSSTNLRRLIGKMGGWLRDRLARRNGRLGPPLPVRSDAGLRDFPTTMKQAIQQQERDLQVIARVLPEGSRLLFVADVFAGHLRKTPTQEETRLFEYNDAINERVRQGQWGTLKECLAEHWPAYTELLKQMCQRLGIPFFDLNRAEYDGWCFVDRIHMTDHGQAQVAAHLASRLS